MKKIKVQPATESVPVYEFRQYANRSMQISLALVAVALLIAATVIFN